MAPTPEPERPIEVFLSYAREDEQLVEQLKKHLKILKRQGLITSWYDREISGGMEWRREIDKHLNTAQIILLLVSADFMTSDYSDSREMMQALKRHQAGEARVIPILLRPVDWRETPLVQLYALPSNAIPITSWSNGDEAFSDVAKGIRRVVEELTKTSSPASIHTVLADLSEEPPCQPDSNVLHQRNSLFTGREDVLSHLYDTLIKGKAGTSTLPQVLVGLDSIGKTQIAVEYAYRYGRNYQSILWAKADSRKTLVSDFVAIADLLNLPEKNVQDQNLAVAAVRSWMEDHTDWLLIFDNVDNLGMVSDFIPSTSKGHILLTTQVPTTARIAQRVNIDGMDPEEGALLLLRLANVLAPEAPLASASESDRITAIEMSQVMDGLPLALELAGAYIRETHCGLAGYMDRYSRKCTDLQKWRSETAPDYPESVATTCVLTLEEIKRTNSAAVELLHLCAFLYPDAIPQEIITEGFNDFIRVPQLDAANPFTLDSALNELLTYSLVRPAAVHHTSDAGTLTIHRLVQAILRDEMDKEPHREWAERTTRVVNYVFPHVKFSTWERCERYLPHAQVSAECIKQWDIVVPEAVQLLHRAAYYLKERGQYPQAESLSIQALKIQEKVLGLEHLDVAQSLDHLAEIYHVQSKYSEAESHYQRALAIRERALGPNAADVAQSLNNLATLYNDRGRYSEAEPLFKRALDIREQVLGLSHPDVATSLNNLALLYRTRGKYDKAEPLFKRALNIREQTLKPIHPDRATSLNNLATLYSSQGRYAEAEPLFEEALAIDKEACGLNHPNLARDLSNLGKVLEAREDLAGALSHYKQALHIDEKMYGPNHPNIAVDVNNLGSILQKLGNLEEAQVLYERALHINEKAYGPNHPNVATSLNNLGSILRKQGKLKEAQALYKQALTIVESAYDQNHPSVANIINNLAIVHQDMQDLAGAQALYEQALTTVEATYGPNHPDVEIIVENLGGMLQEAGDRAEATGDKAGAQAHYEQALQLYQEHLGEDHPYVTQVAENLHSITGDTA